MTKEEREQQHLEDWQRGRDSMTIDAFKKTKEELGEIWHYLSPVFRKRYHYWLNWCHRYYMKSKTGGRYGLCSFDDMVSYYKNLAIKKRNFI